MIALRNVLLLTILANIAQFINCEGSNNSTRTILEFGPVQVAEFEHVGSQEVIYFKVPSSYLSNFTFEFTSGVVQTGSGVSQSCPDVVATFLIRKWSLPVPNPMGSAMPPNTMVHDKDTVVGKFEISQSRPNQSYEIELSETGDTSTDIDFYMSLFLGDLNDDSYKVDGVSKTCVYLVKVWAKANSLVPVDSADINSDTYIDGLNSSYIKSDYQLERHRNGLFNTDFKTRNEGYNVSEKSSVRFSWIVEPYTDVGGTLKLQLGAKPDHNSTAALLTGCVMWGPDFSNTNGSCSNGHKLSLNVSDTPQEVAIDTWHWPFPRSGLWVLELNINCEYGDCDTDINYVVYLQTNIIDCIDSCHADDYQGNCRLYRTDVLLFMACDCKAGWAGIACTDGTNAIPYSKQMLIVLLLTLSNIIFFPCGILATKRGYYSEAIVYFFVMFFSSFYHACDNEYSFFLCIMKYDTLQFSDFLGSITAIWVTLIAVADLPSRVESWFHVAGLMAISVGVSYNRFSFYTTLIPVLCGLVILAFKWGRTCKQEHECFPPKKIWFYSLLPGGLCAIVGFILFAFVETTDNYFYTHSMWHVLMGTAVLFLIPKERKYSSQQHGSPCTSESSSLNCYNVNAAMMSETELSDNSA